MTFHVIGNIVEPMLKFHVYTVTRCFPRKDGMKIHVKKFHSESAKGKLLTMMNYFPWSYFIPTKYLA